MRRLTRVSMIGCLLALFAWSAAGLGQDGRIRSGRMIYEEHCYRCHGPNGEGDGPDAERLIVKPTNFHSPDIRAKSDFELWMAAAYGVAYTPMHGWLMRLPEEEILEALSYIRELAPPK
ncbi:hypothetical protein YTPLAS18_36230 [Nitrospira sp.]|nr:hypothetical protein YTPLAS18_36230 [Nitrospira sp.]